MRIAAVRHGSMMKVVTGQAKNDEFMNNGGFHFAKPPVHEK